MSSIEKNTKCALYFLVRDCSLGPNLSRTSRMYTSPGSLGKATLPGSGKPLRKRKTDNDAFAQLSNYLESRET